MVCVGQGIAKSATHTNTTTARVWAEKTADRGPIWRHKNFNKLKRQNKAIIIGQPETSGEAPAAARAGRTPAAADADARPRAADSPAATGRPRAAATAPLLPPTCRGTRRGPGGGGASAGHCLAPRIQAIEGSVRISKRLESSMQQHSLTLLRELTHNPSQGYFNELCTRLPEDSRSAFDKFYKMNIIPVHSDVSNYYGEYSLIWTYSRHNKFIGEHSTCVYVGRQDFAKRH